MTDIAAGPVLNESTERAKQSTVLTPNFYTTDYAAMDRIDVSPVQGEWDAMMDEFRRDANIEHFERDRDFRAEVAALPEDLRKEFLSLLTDRKD